MPVLQDSSFTDPVAYMLHLSHQASDAVRAEAEQALKAHAEAAASYLKEVDVPDVYPFVTLPEGTEVRELPDGGRLFVLPDGAFIRYTPEASFAFAGESGELQPLEPKRGKLPIPDGRVFELISGATQATHEVAGIEGLPEDLLPEDLGGGRFKVVLPDDIQLWVSHANRHAAVVNPEGTLVLLSPARIEGIGEAVDVRLIPQGGRSFAGKESGNRGFVSIDGTIQLAVRNGLDLVIRFDSPDTGFAESDNPSGFPFGVPV